MSEETVKTRNSWAYWLIIAGCLIPLLPYAIGGSGG